nr:hypothetical protein [Desulfuromonas sp. DDH964]
MVRNISGAFMGGLLGALVDSLNIWWLGKAGVTAALGIGLAPEFTMPWLYPRLVWGGLWGLLLLLPLVRERTLLRGLLISLAPSAIVLLVVFPGMGKGHLGLGFGTLTPILVVLLNFIWGMVASAWHRAAGR